MQRFLTITLTLLAVLLAASLSFAGPKAPGDLHLAPPAAWKASKSSVAFSHSGHAKAKIDCKSCHHAWDGKGPVRSCAAAGCHDQPGKKGERAFYSAFHAKADRSCLGCHKSVKAKGGHAPVACKECHAK